MKKLFIFLFFVSFSILSFSDVEEVTDEAIEEQKEEDPIQSLREERSELLLYGIDSQVIELIDSLRDEKDISLTGEVHAVFKTNLNPKVRSSAIELFRMVDYRLAVDDAAILIDTFEEEDPGLLMSAVRYLTDDPQADLEPKLLLLLESTDGAIIRAALKGLGVAGGKKSVEVLLEYLDDSDFDDNLKPEIILALGDLKDPSAIDPLLDILEDSGEDPTWRRYACASLGKIADPSVLPNIKEILFEEDAIMRSYAVGALRYFDTAEINPLLISALKDSFWRVRVSAAQGLGEKKVEEAVPILIFKAEKDPENNVREEAVQALGEIANQPALEALRKLYGSDLTPMVLRVSAAEILAEKDLEQSLVIFRQVIDKHWGKKDSRILERTAFILSITSSATLSVSLQSFYSRFLDSGDIVIMIYGIRGIERNNLQIMKEAVENLAEEENHRSIRKAALSALDTLNQ
jgi:HEAT repeat protein